MVFSPRFGRWCGLGATGVNWGFAHRGSRFPCSRDAGAQVMGSPEIVGEGLQEDDAADLGHRSYPHDGEAAALENAIEGLDPGAALVDGLAGVTGHARAPSLDRLRFALALPRSLALSFGAGIGLVGRHRGIYVDLPTGQVGDVLPCGVMGVDQHALRLDSEAPRDLFEHDAGQAGIVPPVRRLECENDAGPGVNGELNVVAGTHRAVGKLHYPRLGIGEADARLILLRLGLLVALRTLGLLGAQP